jgi:hypothetical protein
MKMQKLYALIQREQVETPNGSMEIVKFYNGEVHTSAQCCINALSPLELTPVYGPIEFEVPAEICTKAWFESQQPVNLLWGGAKSASTEVDLAKAA